MQARSLVELPLDGPETVEGRRRIVGDSLVEGLGRHAIELVR